MAKLKKKVLLLFSCFVVSLTSCGTSSNSSDSSSNNNSSIKYDDIDFDDAVPEIDIKEEKFDQVEIGS